MPKQPAKRVVVHLLHSVTVDPKTANLKIQGRDAAGADCLIEVIEPLLAGLLVTAHAIAPKAQEIARRTTPMSLVGQPLTLNGCGALRLSDGRACLMLQLDSGLRIPMVIPPEGIAAVQQTLDTLRSGTPAKSQPPTH